MKIANALKWSFLGQVSYFALFFVFNVILSRILSPADFGLFAIISTVIIFFSLIKDFGLGNYLITRSEITKEVCDTIFYFNLAFTLTLFGIIFLISPFIADFYKDERLTMLMRFSGFAFIIDAISTVPNAMMVRDMDFYRLFLVKVVSTAIAGVISILLALSDWGIYSLVFQSVLFSFFSCLLVFVFHPYKPGRSFQWNKCREIVKFSLPLFMSQFVQYFSRNIDNLIIGRVFGSSPLGFYNRAYTIMQMPLQNISTAVSSVLFPVLSKSAADQERRATIYRKAILGIAFTSFPIMGFVFIFSGEIIYFLYGSKWSGVSELLKIFSIVGLLETIITPVGILLMSAGKTSELFRFSTWLRLFIIGMIISGAFFSVKAVALFYLIATVFITPYALFYAAREVGKPFLYLATPLLRIFVVTLLAVAPVYLIRGFLPGLDLVLLLGLSGVLYLSLYLFFSRFLSKEAMKDCISIIINRQL